MLPWWMKKIVRNKALLVALLALGGVLGMTLMADAAQAQLGIPSLTSTSSTATGDEETGESCTTFKQRFQGNTSGTQGDGMLTEIYKFIKEVVDGATQKVFNNFINNSSYQLAVNATTILAVAIFGVLFTIGVVQLNAGQVLVRLIKIGVIFSVVGPGGWAFFSETVVRFFNDGTDDLVRSVINIATGTSQSAGSSPFAPLDELAEKIIHPDSMKMLLGAITSGPYGAGMAGLSMIAFGAFIKMLVDALRIYAVAYVARSLMLSLAPIFIVFMLFERTKQLFIVWVNSLLSTMLQPVLMFIFLAFFVGMIDNAAKNLFGSMELCWAEFDATSGTTNRVANFRFKDKNGKVITERMTSQGVISCLMGGGSDCSEFPVDILDLLTFLLLVFLASRFAEVVDRVANELSGTFIALDAGGKIDKMISNQLRGTTGGG